MKSSRLPGNICGHKDLAQTGEWILTIRLQALAIDAAATGCARPAFALVIGVPCAGGIGAARKVPALGS